MSAGFATRPLPLGKFGSETGSNGSERASPKLRSPRLSPEKRFVVGLNTHPNEFPKNYYGTRVTSPRQVDDDRLLSTRMSSTQASARPRRDPPVSPRNLPKLQATMTTQGMDAAKPWGGSKPLPWMVCPDGSMADDMNVVPLQHYKTLMQEAKDMAMADGELDDQEKLALENPKERSRAMLQKTAAQICDDQKIQHAYSDVFHRFPPPGLFYAEAILQPAPVQGYKPHEGDSRPRWMPAFMNDLGSPAAAAAAAAASMPKLAENTGKTSPRSKAKR